MSRPLHGMRILVADDDSICREVAQDLLQAVGATVILAENGSEAAKLCLDGGTRPDAVLIDQEMPVLTGLGATLLIRASVTADELPIIGLSSLFGDAHRAAALAAGMNDCLRKPFDLDDILRALLRHWGPPGVRQQTQRVWATPPADVPPSPD